MAGCSKSRPKCGQGSRCTLGGVWPPWAQSAAMSDDDSVVILDNPTLQMLGVDIYDSLDARTRDYDWCRYSGMYRQCRRVTASVEALQQRPGHQQEEPDVAVARMVARGPEHEPA